MLTSDDCKTGGPNVLGILNWKTKFRNRTLSRGDALKASWREKPFDGSGRIPEIWVQSKNMLVSDHFIIVARKNGECKRKKIYFECLKEMRIH